MGARRRLKTGPIMRSSRAPKLVFAPHSVEPELLRALTVKYIQVPVALSSLPSATESTVCPKERPQRVPHVRYLNRDHGHYRSFAFSTFDTLFLVDDSGTVCHVMERNRH